MVPIPVGLNFWNSSRKRKIDCTSPCLGGRYQQQPRYGPSSLWMVIQHLSSTLSSSSKVTRVAISSRAKTAIPPPPLDRSPLYIFTYPSNLKCLSPGSVFISFKNTTWGIFGRRRIAATTLAEFVLNPFRLQCKNSNPFICCVVVGGQIVVGSSACSISSCTSFEILVALSTTIWARFETERASRRKTFNSFLTTRHSRASCDWYPRLHALGPRFCASPSVCTGLGE